MTALAKLVLACFRNSRDPRTLLESLAGWLDVVAQVRRARHGVHAFQRVLRYIYDTSGGLSDRRIRAFLKRAEDPALAEEIVTLAQMYENRGLKKGRQEGLQKGLQEGLQKGRALTLLRQLQTKFGRVPARAAARVKTADEATLDRWADQVLTARTLAEALA